LENKEESKGFYGDLTRSSTGNHWFPSPYFISKNQIIDIFSNIGFNVSEGPEDDWHNFTALNLTGIPSGTCTRHLFIRLIQIFCCVHLIGSGTLHGK
jgi:hypothetical protein